MKVVSGTKMLSKEASIHWKLCLKGKPPKVSEFSISLTATEFKGSPCIWRADTAHGRAHEHRFWNGRVIQLTQERKSDYQATFEECLTRATRNFKRFLRLFDESKKRRKK